MNNAQTVAGILDGTIKASAAMGRPELFGLLNAGANGPLDMLGESHKIEAGENFGVYSKVLYMMPANESGRQACSFAGNCADVCLAEGVGQMSIRGSRRARRRRHASFYADRARFLETLAHEIARHERAAKRKGKVCAVRLNGTTDLPWHKMPLTYNGKRYPNLHAIFPAVRFYEYTKYPLALQRSRGILPPNLWLTFSVSEDSASDERAAEYLEAGYSAAVVMRIKRHDIPARWALGGIIAPVVDGDLHDARFMDPPGAIVALSAKGKAKRDASGFVREATA